MKIKCLSLLSPPMIFLVSLFFPSRSVWASTSSLEGLMTFQRSLAVWVLMHEKWKIKVKDKKLCTFGKISDSKQSKTSLVVVRGDFLNCFRATCLRTLFLSPLIMMINFNFVLLSLRQLENVEMRYCFSLFIIVNKMSLSVSKFWHVVARRLWIRCWF